MLLRRRVPVQRGWTVNMTGDQKQFEIDALKIALESREFEVKTLREVLAESQRVSEERFQIIHRQREYYDMLLASISNPKSLGGV